MLCRIGSTARLSEDQARLEMHGDDFTILAHGKDIVEYRRQMKKKFEITFKGMIGPDDGDVKTMRVL